MGDHLEVGRVKKRIWEAGDPEGQQSAQNGVELEELSRRDGQCYP
jgi:hypothetical protein